MTHTLLAEACRLVDELTTARVADDHQLLDELLVELGVGRYSESLPSALIAVLVTLRAGTLESLAIRLDMEPLALLRLTLLLSYE